MSLNRLLPQATQIVWDREDEAREMKLQQRPASALVMGVVCVPPYGQRKGWVPRSKEDYGDGGALPEIHVAQYPVGMGVKGKENTSNALAVQLDFQGKVKYDLLARQGHSKGKIVYSKLTDLLPSEILPEDDSSLQKPSAEEAEKITEITKSALENIIKSKIGAAMPPRRGKKQAPPQYIRYTPYQQEQNFNSGAKQRVIRMVEAQVDPIELPKFKTNKKIPRRPPSPPAPVLHSPTRKLTAKDLKEWRIPPCISNWKNRKGYTIQLDKRLAADGRGLQQVHINEKFSKFSEGLYIAGRKAREGVETRAQLKKKLAQKEKEKKENDSRQLAEKLRNERTTLGSAAVSDNIKTDEIRERKQLRQERHKDRARERNIARVVPDKKMRLQREGERDISEQIALGMPAKNINMTGDQAFDQRLFNTTKGMDSGYVHDDEYNVYDKPWRDQNSTGSHIYRPSKNPDFSSKFVPDKEFSGTDRTRAARSGPVQYEKEEDPFGLDHFLKQAKRASSSTAPTKHKEFNERKSSKEDRHKKRKN